MTIRAFGRGFRFEVLTCLTVYLTRPTKLINCNLYEAGHWNGPSSWFLAYYKSILSRWACLGGCWYKASFRAPWGNCIIVRSQSPFRCVTSITSRPRHHIFILCSIIRIFLNTVGVKLGLVTFSGKINVCTLKLSSQSQSAITLSSNQQNIAAKRSTCIITRVIAM